MKSSKTLIIITLLAVGMLLSACGGPLPVLSWPGLSVDIDNNIYISYSSEVLAYKVDTNTPLWRFPITKDQNLMFYAEPLVLENVVVVGDFGKTIFGINKTTGVEEWKFAEASGHFIAGAVGIEGTILAPCADGTLYALDAAKNGQLLWKFTTPKPLWAKVAVDVTKPVNEETLVYQGSMDHFLYAINLKTGREVWKVDVGAAIVFAPVLDPESGTLYVGTVANELLAVKDGKILARRYPTKGGMWTTPILKDGNLFFADGAGWFHVIRANDFSIMLGPVEIGSPVMGNAAVLPENKGFAYVTANNEVALVDLNGRVSKITVNGKLATGPVLAGEKLLILISQSQERLIQFMDFDGLDKGSITPPTQ